jgi:hypothetical protein
MLQNFTWADRYSANQLFPCLKRELISWCYLTHTNIHYVYEIHFNITLALSLLCHKMLLGLPIIIRPMKAFPLEISVLHIWYILRLFNNPHITKKNTTPHYIPFYISWQLCTSHSTVPQYTNQTTQLTFALSTPRFIFMEWHVNVI